MYAAGTSSDMHVAHAMLDHIKNGDLPTPFKQRDVYRNPPPARNLLAWIKRETHQSAANNPSISRVGLAEVIAKSIAYKGTPANPFRTRTVEKMRSLVFDIIRESTEAGLRETGFKG